MKNSNESLEEAGTYSFHFAEGWKNFGLIFIKLFTLIFDYLLEILILIIKIIYLLIKLVSLIVFNIILMIFFCFYSVIPLKNSHNPLEHGKLAKEIVVKLEHYKHKRYIVCIELEGVLF